MKHILVALLTTFAVTLQAFASHEILVVNETNQPIAGAEVLVGPAPNDPFPDNLLTTDLNGVATIPDEWRTVLPITIEADGYLRTTFAQAAPTTATFQLHRMDSHNLLEIRGQTSHFQGIKKDGKVDFGLVFPALSRRQLLQFDVSTMISPEVDTIKILTEKFTIPSNVTLPDQKETYVLPVTLNKPSYRMFVKQPGTYRMVAAHGQFPIKQVISHLSDGKSFFEVLNLFNFFAGGQRDIQVTASVSGQDIAVNQVPFNSEVRVTGPALAGTDVMVSIPLTNQNGVFFPSDLKSIKQGETRSLKTPNVAPSNVYIMSLMLPAEVADQMGRQGPPYKDVADELTSNLAKLFEPASSAEGAMSLSFQPAGETSVVPEFMSLVNKPVVQDDLLTFSRPVAGSSIKPLGTYVILSEITKPPQGQYGAEMRYRLWEIFAEGWVDQIQLPKLVNNIQPGKNYRWEVLFLGTNNSHSNGGYFLDEVTHLSRNALDF